MYKWYYMFMWYAMKCLLSIENFNRNVSPYNQGMNLDWVFARAQSQQVMSTLYFILHLKRVKDVKSIERNI